MDVLVLIDKLDDLVHNAKAVPLTDQVRIDREEIYDILDQMRATIPEEIKQARWIVKERQEMLAEAKRETDRLLGEAREQAVREASQTEIVKIAERQAQDIVDEARRQARETRLEMEDWADSILSTLEVNLERRQDRVGPVLHLEPRFPCLSARLVDDVLRLPLRDLDDLRLRRLAHRLLARLAQEPVGLALRLGEHLLPLLDDPAGLLDFLGDRGPHLVEDVVDLLAVDPDLIGQGHGLRVVNEVVELVDEYEYVHGLLFLRILRGTRPTVGKQLGKPPGYGLRDEFVHFPAEGSDLLHAARGDEAHGGAGHHVDRLHVGRQGAVQLVHLELPFEVGDHPQALHDHLGVPLVGEVDDELREDRDLDVRQIRESVLEEGDTLVECEHRRLVRRVAHHPHDQAVEDPGSTADHVDVAVRDRIV